MFSEEAVFRGNCCDVGLGDLLGITLEHKRYRAVVGQLNFHHRAKYALFHLRHSLLLEQINEGFDQGSATFGGAASTQLGRLPFLVSP